MTIKSLSTTSLIAALWLGTAALPAIAQGPGAGGGPGGPGGGCGGRGAQMFQRLDTNGDGKITQDEFRAGRDARFAAMDQNGDGKVTQQEFEAAPRPGKQGPRTQQMFQRADANGDGVITRDEFDRNADLQFKRLDANGDGVITRDEVQQARAHKGCPGTRTDDGPGRAGQGRTQQ
jgi:EF hand domain-containing protein